MIFPVHSEGSAAASPRHWPLLVAAALLAALPGSVAQAANGEIELRVVDEQTGELIAARMHLKKGGKVVKPKDVVFWHDHFMIPGKILLDLPPGEYQFELERGPEYRVRTGYFLLKSRDADAKEIALPRFVDMKQEGWWSGDLHIHRPLADIPLLMKGEDLHIAPVITWWRDKNQWQDELPKQLTVPGEDDRFYNIMAGEDEREGGALLYFNLEKPLPLAGAEREHPSPAHFLKQAARQPGAHIDIEKPFWWDMPVWVASQMTHSIGLAHNHMQRGGVLANEAWGKPRDKTFFPDPEGNGLWTTDIYYRLLNCGVRLPPSAGSASGVLPNPVGYNRVYVHVDGELTWDKWWAGLRAGQVVVTNGPLLRPLVNGELPGHVFQAPAGGTLSLQPTLNLALRDRVDYLEVVKDGKVVHQVRLDKYAEAGGRLPEVEFDQSGWLLIRAICTTPHTFRFASTGPYYVEIGEQPRISQRDAKFFLDWVVERATRIRLTGAQRDEVIQYHRAARDYWQQKLDAANAP
ncbi:MAG: CehA/McbA family metallohydrolase [Planctomycetales bacterium]|nr:CehA/McbA family metallohydrolase [Planctomycetales bacterium]